MSTSQSPPAKLRADAERIVALLKQVASGMKVAEDRGGKIAASLKTGVVTFAVVQDDKIVKVTMAWDDVRVRKESDLVEFVLAYMSGETKQ